LSEPSNSKTGRILVVIGRLALAAVFLFAAYAKLKPQTPEPWSVDSIKTSLSMFAMQVDSYQMLSSESADFVAHSLPFFELALGLWILSGIWLRISSVASTLLLGGFFAIMVRTYAKGLEINCGCFGPGEHLGPKTLIRDGSLLALSIAVAIGAYLLARRKTNPPEPAASPIGFERAR